MDYFEIHLVEHCNLKCQCCDNFSPLAEEEYAEEEVFKNDMNRMSELFPNIELIRLLGGEPLLHPNITFFISETRTNFPNTEIRITTNAILLNKMTEDFWLCCNKNNIVIEYTYYPINIDRQKHKDLANKYNVKLTAFPNAINDKTTWRFPLHDKKDQDIISNYNNCWRSHCVSLKQGKLYICTCIPNIYHFNKYFNKNFEITEEDYIDIYNHTAEEIEEYLSKPVPFCGYCLINEGSCCIPWARTKFDISEWYNK